MRSRLLERLQVVEERFRTPVVGRTREEAAGSREFPNRRLWIGVVLRIVETGSHVQELANRRVADAATLQLGQIARDGRRIVQGSLGDQDFVTEKARCGRSAASAPK